ncbi:pectinesterase inhibitor 9-like [Cynara cardunculus var. scolymus]|uniref:pectinesterase inhibitor 9-like n=1 Tax=Cynara cardunculus var. scolymus TaxID=59895 RepID=UPI000D626FC0|nr:pectinesterase inhibitor 9-like [Cynara cardunculus var. scolymus]
MDKLLFYLLLLLIIIQFAPGAVTKPTPLNFVKTSCKTTLYPALCVNSLSSYAGSINGHDQQLAKSAVLVSLNNAKSLTTFVSRLAKTSKTNPRESQALKDCISSMASSVASLTQSVQELGKMAQFKGQNLVWHMNNVETWVSSALTNQNICAGGFSDRSMNGKVKDAVYRKMNSVTQITSNALALVNGFASRHKKVAHKP